MFNVEEKVEGAEAEETEEAKVEILGEESEVPSREAYSIPLGFMLRHKDELQQRGTHASSLGYDKEEGYNFVVGCNPSATLT
uniref:Uncharacterized protein n=1 Tax=Nelumbo nucifera TaxID=4432 RepID=A0A822ZGZ2_NELNU|nr:TPA_asm: hypothetical protein HUJ06_001990 [Nelumbo nucifera]